jgi:diguanylate cyclase (GGDEF)-like protein
MLQSEVPNLSDDGAIAAIGVGEMGVGDLSPTALLIDSEIQRYASSWSTKIRAAVLRFPDEIEQRFEADTGAARSYELRLTIGIALGFYVCTSVTDGVFVPDLGINAFLIRMIGFPLLAILVAFAPKLSAWWREALATIAATVGIIMLVTVPAVSSAPLAPFGFIAAALGQIYANATFPLRFKSACLCSTLCSIVVIVLIFRHPGIDFDLGFALAFQTVVAASSTLITSYRIERNVRLNYLLASREALRLSVLKADRELLTTRSNTDALTGLVNRGHFDRHSTALFANPANAGKETALLFIDVDYFKHYNDYYGHPAGDACLRAIAAAVASALHGTDGLAARYGGEEFAVLLIDVSKRQAEMIAKRACKAVSSQKLQHMNRIDGVRNVTISVGVACGVIGEHCTVKGLIETADNALYRAKRGGRNRVEFRISEAA